MRKISILRSLLIAAMAVVAALTFSSCDNEPDEPEYVCWDIAPIELYFDMVDENGVTLLDTARADNALNHDIYIEMNGKRYEMNDSIYQIYRSYGAYRSSLVSGVDGRVYLARFQGLQLWPVFDEDIENNKIEYTSRLMLKFGEFAGDRDHDINLTIVWPEAGVRRQVRVVNKYEWKKNEPRIERTYYLDGDKLGEGQFEALWPITLRRPALPVK